MLNQIVFWMTANQRAEKNPDKAKHWNIRDFANALELSILFNLETLNAEYIKQWLDKRKRFELLYKKAREIMKSIANTKSVENLQKEIDDLPQVSLKQ